MSITQTSYFFCILCKAITIEQISLDKLTNEGQVSLLVISNLFKINNVKDRFENSNGDFMNQKEFFSKFELLKNVKEEKKNQLYKHFSTAPDWVIDSCSVEKIKPNTVFVRENEPVHTIYFITEGTFKAIDYRVIGVEYEFAQFTNVYAMGGMEVIMDFYSYRTTLKTIDSCIAIKMPKAIFEKWLMSNINTMRYETKMMGEYLLEQGRLAREYLFLPGPVRIAKILIVKYERKAHNGILKLQINRQSISNETGFSKKTVTRSIKTLYDADLITKKDKYILVNQEQYLRLKQSVEDIVAPLTDEQDRIY